MDESIIKEGDEISKFADHLKESYELDTVVILATKTRKGLTHSYSGSAGNYYAIYGSISDWILRADTRTINEVSNEE